MPEAGAPGQVHAGGFAGGEETDDSLPAHTTPRLARWCAELLVTAEWAGSQLVLRTPAGAAQLLAGAVDDAMMPGVLGCIAGDDTVLVVTRSPQVAAEVAGHLARAGRPLDPNLTSPQSPSYLHHLTTGSLVPSEEERDPMSTHQDRVVLAYSGGLDTSVAIGWIGEATGREVVAVPLTSARVARTLR